MLLALLAWVWVAGSALARDRPASERFAIGALAADIESAARFLHLLGI